mgnify:CR=1 FL=1
MTTIAIRGNTVAPVEIRYTSSGRAVGNVTVAENIGKDDQKRTNFHRVTLWAELAEHAASLDKGTSVIVVGRLEQREYETKDGEKRTVWEVTADAFGPDLRFQTVTVARTGSTGGHSAPPVTDWASAQPQAAQTAYSDDSSVPF